MDLHMHIMQSPPGAETIIDGKRYVYFVGTGYFCLQGHPMVIEASCEASRKYGIGSATSRVGYGNNPALLDVERLAAEFFDTEDSFYFVSGYCGNGIMAKGLRDDYDAIFIDSMSHYSILDGIQQANKKSFTFAHCDPEDLSSTLKKNLLPRERAMVMADGIFPMTGEISPVQDYLKVLDSYPDSSICLDDAHAVGVLGDNGRGTFEHFSLEGDNLYFSGTLSKAIGGHGGIIPDSKPLLDRIKSASHLYNGSSPPPVAAAAATAKALEIVMKNPDIRTRLWENTKNVKSGLRSLGLDIEDTNVPIICLDFDNPERMRKIQQALEKKGIMVAYVEQYGKSGGIIRIAVFSEHTDEMIEQLIYEISRII